MLLSFPHNPTTATVELEFMQRVVDLAREREFVVVHDFAYAELGFDGYRPPSILQADGAQDVAVELYSLTKGFSMAGWRVGFLVGNAEIVGALARLKSWLDYGTFSPIQIASVIALTEAADHPDEVREIYRSRRDALHTGLTRIGWDAPLPRGHDVPLGAAAGGSPRRGLARVRAPARARGARRGQPRRRVRAGG